MCLLLTEHSVEKTAERDLHFFKVLKKKRNGVLITPYMCSWVEFNKPYEKYHFNSSVDAWVKDTNVRYESTPVYGRTDAPCTASGLLRTVTNGGFHLFHDIDEANRFINDVGGRLTDHDGSELVLVGATVPKGAKYITGLMPNQGDECGDDYVSVAATKVRYHKLKR